MIKTRSFYETWAYKTYAYKVLKKNVLLTSKISRSTLEKIRSNNMRRESDKETNTVL